LPSEENEKFSFRWFLPAIRKHRRVLAEVFVASFFIQLLGLSNPLLTQIIIDKVLVQNSLSALNVLGVLFVVIAIASVALTAARTYLFVDTTNRIDLSLGSRIMDHLYKLRLGYFQRRPVGEVSSRLQSRPIHVEQKGLRRDRAERTAMRRTRAALAERCQVCSRWIAFVSIKTIVWVALGEVCHEPIPCNLGHDTGGCNGKTEAVSLYQGHMVQRKVRHRQAIHQRRIQPAAEKTHGPAHGLTRGLEDVHAVYVLRLQQCHRPADALMRGEFRLFGAGDAELGRVRVAREEAGQWALDNADGVLRVHPAGFDVATDAAAYVGTR
jgi:hypothetical protein